MVNTSPFKEGRKGCCGESGNEGKGTQGLAFRSDGTSTCILEFKRDEQILLRTCSNACGSKVELDSVSTADRDAKLHEIQISYDNDATLLSLGPISSKRSHDHVDTVSTFECKNGAGKKNVHEGERQGKRSSNPANPNLDLNVVDIPVEEEENPFFPYKKLDQLRKSDESECGSTTGPVVMTDNLRRWMEMKKNGFLSCSQGMRSSSVPKVRGRSVKKDVDFRKKAYHDLKEQVPNRISELTASSGLLSELNPGIINHVRNSKQVYSIIEAVLQSEKQESQRQLTLRNQAEQGTSVRSEVSKEGTFLYGSPYHSRNEWASRAFAFPECKEKAAGQNKHATPYLSENAGNVIPKLSPHIAMDSEKMGTSNEGLTSMENPTILSVQAAMVASQWLNFLQEDLKGRIAALRRSKKRTRMVIQKELPQLLSTEIMSNKEKNLAAAPCEFSTETHVMRWRSLFGQLDKVLNDEGRTLEFQFREVHEMKMCCEKGLKYFNMNNIVNTVDQFSIQKISEASEMGKMVNAAAASIYSTCNFSSR